MSSRAPVELDFLGLGAASTAETTKSSMSVQTSRIANIEGELQRRVMAEPPAETAPLTVFYNGSVAVFDVSNDKAEAIMRMATEVSEKEERNRDKELVGNFAKDLPLARAKSLQRFLQKRKERLTPVVHTREGTAPSVPRRQRLVM